MAPVLGFAAAVLLAQIVSVSSSTQTLDPNVVKAADFAMGAHNRMTNYPYAYKVVEILSHSAQIYPPAWVKFSVEVRAVETTCRNNGTVNLQDCAVAANAKMMTCSFTVLAVPGQDTIPESVLSQQCA